MNYSDYSNIVFGTTFSAKASALIDRMTALGEEPTTSRKSALNTCINSLIGASLFDTQWDVFVVTRAHGAGSGLLNWVGTSFNGTGVDNPTFTANVGYNSNGSSSYIRTNYIPNVHASLFQQNDASFLIKVSGIISAGYYGAFPATGRTAMYYGGGANSGINDASAGTHTMAVGYNCMSRKSSTKWDSLVNASATERTNTSTGRTSTELYIMRLNFTTPFYANDTQIFEIYAMGKQISAADFLILQGIMNTYFASF